jgi:hypothetical protein
MNKVKPALLGGLIVGLLSAIPFVNYCCCIWSIGGGLVAGLLYIKASPSRVSPGDGAIIGALTGVFGAIIYLIIGLPIAYFFGAAAMEDAIRNAGIELPMSGVLLMVVGSLLVALCLLILSVIGGLIAVPIFEKRKDVVPPPAPGSF